MNYKIYGTYVLITCAFFYVGCGNNNTNQTLLNDSIQNSVKKEVNLDSSGAKMFAMPAPMQVVTMIRNANIPYSEKSLTPPKPPGSFASEYLKALHLGIYTVDLGYLIAYEQRQSALNYYKTVDDLLNSLNISQNIDHNTIKRFEKNVNNTDSLCSIVLESYGKWQNYFQEDQREAVGLYIIAGSYIEALYLSLLQTEKNDERTYKNLIGQQKLFLDNILELSNYMDKKTDFDDLYSKLGSIQDVYSQINVKVTDDIKGETVIQCNYTPQQIKALVAKVTEIRNSTIR